MAFDAGMLRFVTAEINERLTGGKVDKIYQPSKTEVVLNVRSGGADHRLMICAGGNGARINLTSLKPENPEVPPMFCMMLRKHFSGARFAGAEQLGFERAVRLSFDTHDEMGFASRKHIICELMGRFSNIIITDAGDKVIGLLRPIDFSTSERRQVLAGMIYDEPPKQDKTDPLSPDLDEREFNRLAGECEGEKSAEKFIMSNFSGIAPLVAREIVFRAAGRVDASLDDCSRTLSKEFFRVVDDIKSLRGEPILITDSDGEPVEYSFTDIKQYGLARATVCGSFGELLDKYFGERGRTERIRKKAADLFKLLSNAEARIVKKTALQEEELRECDEGEKFKLWGDLITANIYRLERGMESCSLPNYWDEGSAEVTVPLDSRLTPSANAQRYYKKYTKSKAARVHLTAQLEASRAELDYVYSVLDALSRAEGERALNEIRAELYHSGYASKMKNYSEKKQSAPIVIKYRTSDGHTVLCGHNNTSNDYLTTKLADRGDWWFHVKDQPGAHVVLVCADGESDPPESAFTDAAEIAAYNSRARGGVMIPVDYTRVSKVKKPAGSKPGLVIYTTNWTAFVTPDEEKIAAMRQK